MQRGPTMADILLLTKDFLVRNENTLEMSKFDNVEGILITLHEKLLISGVSLA